MALIRRIIDDLQHGRHREAYALFLIGVALAVLGLTDVVSSKVLLGSILLALSFLVFNTTSNRSDKPALDQVLQSRESFGPFSKLLPGTRDLRIYGPTAINVLVGAADIRRFVLDTGGVVRVLVQSDSTEAIEQASVQLDDNFDFKQTLANSVATLDRLSSYPGFSYRRLQVNPGFSIVIVNAEDSDGYVILEMHGFKDQNIADRMHLVIRRRESPRWFAYWVARYEAMWTTAS
jgi:hypothetical protein